ncbi:hypothetical protein PGB90_004518 [Kerria lacca]
MVKKAVEDLSVKNRCNKWETEEDGYSLPIFDSITLNKKYFSKTLNDLRNIKFNNQQSNNFFDKMFKRFTTLSNKEQDFNNVLNEKSYENTFQKNNLRKIRNTDVTDKRQNAEPSNNLIDNASQMTKASEYVPTVSENPLPIPLNISSIGTLPNTASSTPLLIIGGFNALLIPVHGITSANMANILQMGQQLNRPFGGN